jgi:hypothetical protein
MMQQLLASFTMIVQLLMIPVQLALAVKADVKEAVLYSVELYSPTGNCNHKLAAFPVIAYNPVLVYVDNMIIACSGGKYCWEYNVKKDNWSVIATAQFTHNFQPGVVYQDKVYVMDEASPQVFDPSSRTWSSWPSPPKEFGNVPWMVGWKDCIILLGGTSNLRGVQIFNVTQQT